MAARELGVSYGHLLMVIKGLRRSLSLMARYRVLKAGRLKPGIPLQSNLPGGLAPRGARKQFGRRVAGPHRSGQTRPAGDNR